MRRASPLLLLLLLALPSPGARAVDPCTIGRHAAPAGGDRHAPLVIADSSMLVATPLLGRLGFEADVHACRSIGEAARILDGRRRRGTLPRIVVLAVGANIGVTDADIRHVLAILGHDRLLVLVTPARPPAADRVMRRAARRRPQRIALADWARTGLAERYGGSDPVHSGPAGEAAEAHLIVATLRPYRPPRRLEVPVRAGDAPRCGPGVFVLAGADRIVCSRALALVRTRARHSRLWRAYDWRFTSGRGPWSLVVVRGDKRVVIAQRPA